MNLKDIKWCAEECQRQRSGELSVWWMSEGLEYCRELRTSFITPIHIITLGKIIEPQKNRSGTRKVNVRVGRDIKMSWKQVDNQLTRLLQNQDSLSPDQFYRRYEDIHPFVDGNGRTGSLLYNWLNGTLNSPLHPPDWNNPEDYWSKVEK